MAKILIAGLSRADTTFSEVGLYQSFDSMIAWAAALEADNPEIVRCVDFGNSYEGRPLVALKISTTPQFDSPEKPEFLFTGGLHAREVIGSEACYRLADHLIAGFANKDAAVLDVLAEREVWIVPQLNPDGRARVENGENWRRKNMRPYYRQTYSNYGVDLNRNFPHRWADASRYATSDTYRGPRSLSEDETAALWNLLEYDAEDSADVQHFSDLRAAIDFHSGIQGILTPWISSATSDTPPPEDKFEQLAAEMSRLTGYAINELSYDAYGTLTDSLYEQFGTYALCEELHKGNCSFQEYFTYFNPIDQDGVETVVGNAIASAMFLLSDEAFAIAPEPSLAAMLAAAGVMLLLIRIRNRQ